MMFCALRLFPSRRAGLALTGCRRAGKWDDSLSDTAVGVGDSSLYWRIISDKR